MQLVSWKSACVVLAEANGRANAADFSRTLLGFCKDDVLIAKMHLQSIFLKKCTYLLDEMSQETRTDLEIAKSSLGVGGYQIGNAH